MMRRFVCRVHPCAAAAAETAYSRVRTNLRHRIATRRGAALVLAVGAAFAVVAPARADETSASDKLRILYANRFTFTDDKLPLITVEIASGMSTVTLSARGGIVARPDGATGSAVTVQSADAQWIVQAERPTPSIIRDWVIAASFDPDDAKGVADEIAFWKQAGFEPRTFEIGSVFGVDGEVIDSRQVRVGIQSVARGLGAAKAAELGRQHQRAMFVHQELVQRPSGMIVARRGDTVVRNPSVIWFTAERSDQTITVADVPTGTGGSQLETGTENRRYWGAVYVTLGHDGKLVVANAVPEDKLLAGIVPAEMFPDAPDAALEAQAIAARTELLEKIGRRNLIDPFLLCSTQQCQVYAGAGKEDPRTTRAVAKTRGMVLLRDSGGLVDVRYSASCGGHGEHNDTVWEGAPDPALRGRRDVVARGKTPAARTSVVTSVRTGAVTAANLEAFLQDDPKHYWCGRPANAASRFRWTQRLSVEDLSARVNQDYPQLGRLLALVPGPRGVSGRMRALTLRGERASVEVQGDLRIRRLLGGLKSSLFTVDVEGPRSQPTAFVIRGAGFGHGVGMCQMGAIGMAQAGHTHREILLHYYAGARLRRLY